VLTAIVVGVSLTAVALALIIRIYSAYGTLDEDLIREVADE
jgi:multicomponent Na+:H+ antiporter subunit C